MQMNRNYLEFCSENRQQFNPNSNVFIVVKTVKLKSARQLLFLTYYATFYHFKSIYLWL